MKYSDDLFDVNNDSNIAIIFGILCGVASGFAASAVFVLIIVAVYLYMCISLDTKY